MWSPAVVDECVVTLVPVLDMHQNPRQHGNLCLIARRPEPFRFLLVLNRWAMLAM